MGRDRLCFSRRGGWRPVEEARSSTSPRRRSAMPTCFEGCRDGAVALIQKPMGSDLAEATEILSICRERKLHRRRQFPAALRADDAGLEGRHRQGLAWRGRRFRCLAGARYAMAALAVPGGLAARRDRHALDPLSRPDPAAARRSRAACMPRRSATPHHRWRRRARARSSTMATRCAARCRSITTMSSAARHQACEFRIWAPRARPILQARRQSRLSARRAGHSGDLSEGRQRMGRGAAAGRLVSRRLRRPHGQSAALRGRRGRRAGRFGRGRLVDHGAGRGCLPIERGAGDAASRKAVRHGTRPVFRGL